MDKATYISIHPIVNSDPQDMPVADIDPAVNWYEEKMGFALVGREEQPRAARIERDGVVIRLAENGRDPEQASCYIEVDNVEGAREELAAKGVDVSPLRLDNYGGNRYRVFFAKDDDGLCYCLGTRLTQ